MKNISIEEKYHSFDTISHFFPYKFKQSGRVLEGIEDERPICKARIAINLSRANLTQMNDKKFHIVIISYCSICEKYNESIMVWSDEEIDLCINVFKNGKWTRIRSCLFNVFSNRHVAYVYLYLKVDTFKRILRNFFNIK